MRRTLKINPRRARIRYALEHVAASYKDFEKFNEDYWKKCVRGVYYYATKDPGFRIDDRVRKEVAEGKFIISCTPEGAIKRNPGADFVAEILTVPEQVIEKLPGRNEDVRPAYADLLKVSRVLVKKRAINSFNYQQRFFPGSEQELYFAWERAKRNVELEKKKALERKEKERERQRRRRERRRRERQQRRR